MWITRTVIVRTIAVLVAAILGLALPPAQAADQGTELSSLVESTGKVGAPEGAPLATSNNSVEFGKLKVEILGAVGKSSQVNGRAVWRGEVDHVAQEVPQGLQALSVYRSAKNGNSTAYRLRGYELSKNADGSVSVWRKGLVRKEAPYAYIEKPWARDARGRAVETTYKVRGDVLTQVVRFDRNTVFPVVADPKIVKKWYGWQVRFYKKGTRRIALGGATCTAVLSALPDFTLSKIAAAACGLVSVYAQAGLEFGQCVAINVFKYTSTVVPWYWNC